VEGETTGIHSDNVSCCAYTLQECSGALIAPDAVLTAAHCIYNFKTGAWAYDIKFSPGEPDLYRCRVMMMMMMMMMMMLVVVMVMVMVMMLMMMLLMMMLLLLLLMMMMVMNR
jgi:hypothetical protein